MQKKEKNLIINTPTIVAFISLTVALLSLAVAVSNTNLMVKLARVYSNIQTPELSSANSLRGNGSPAGQHFNLNIIGVPKNIKAPLTQGNAHRIFMPLDGTSQIMLSEGELRVTDGNGTDGNAAFTLPASTVEPEGEDTTAYSVWIRAVGTPGGKSTLGSCMIDQTVDSVTKKKETYCDTNKIVQVRSSGQSQFENVTDKLMYVEIDTDKDGFSEMYGLFDNRFSSTLWTYANQNMKIVQLRFYPVL